MDKICCHQSGWWNAHVVVLFKFQSAVISYRCKFENLFILMDRYITGTTVLLLFLIYWQRDSKLYEPQKQAGCKREGRFLVFSLSVLFLCKSLHAARHLDSTLGQRYEPNFKRQSRDRGTPGWFHHWQDQLQASGSDLILISCALFPVGPSQWR